MNNKIDLHIHTNRSDGIFSEKEIIDLACDNEIEVISITDHDNIDAASTAASYVIGKKITFIPGIEFSIDNSPGELHLLGYGIDFNNSDIIAAAASLSADRESRAKKIIEELRSAGIDIEYNEVMNAARSSGSIGKPHIARMLVEKGYVKRIDQAFRLYFRNGLPGDVSKKKLSFSEGIKLIGGAGGIPVLAHPGSLHLEDEEYIIKLNEFVNTGLRGVEAYASMHSRRQVRFFEKTALERNLLVTGGSDFHGDRRERLGYFGKRKINSEKLKNFTDFFGC
ncbi:MAG: PHP domain-containing protein [Spirochaetes bacterium]|nr:PHP domain-containing protein [Spirochaetota bacterium]